MAIEVNTKVSIGEAYGKKLPNLTLEDVKFFGRPNFSGEMDQFKDDRRKFTILIPNEVADQLREMGWNVKTTIPQKEDQEPLSHLKVMVDFGYQKGHEGDPNYERGPDCWILMGEDREKLTSKTVGLLDRSRVETMDMEIRAWNYNALDVENDGATPEYSARLVTLVATIRPNILDNKYGRLS